MAVLTVALLIGIALGITGMLFYISDYIEQRRFERETQKTIDKFKAFVESQRKIWQSIGK